MFTTGRIDSWLTIGQQAVYLVLILVVLLQMFFAQAAPAAAPAGFFLKRWYIEYRSPLVHFLLGALLNLYAIFYFKSSSLLVSFGFLGVLVAVLLANEVKRIKALGLPVKFALLALCFLSFFAYVVPVLAGSIGLALFLLSMLVGALPLAALVAWIGLKRPQESARARREIGIPLGAVLIVFLACYFFRIIPPVPLSVSFMGVYHQVERAGNDYRLSHERPAWRFWHNGDQWFQAQPGDRVFVYFRVFSPANFADQVQVRWSWKDPARGWLAQDAVPIRITGGREQGFRGYSAKSNYQAGDWKAQVETTDGREIGRIYLEISTAPAGPRSFQTDFD